MRHLGRVLGAAALLTTVALAAPASAEGGTWVDWNCEGSQATVHSDKAISNVVLDYGEGTVKYEKVFRRAELTSWSFGSSGVVGAWVKAGSNGTRGVGTYYPNWCFE